MPLLEEALAAQGNENTPLRARLLARLAGALRDEREPSRRVATGALGVQIARQCGDPTALAYALAGLSGARHGIGPERERLAIADELRQAALRLHDKEYEFEAWTAELLVYFERGAMAEVHERLAIITAIGDDLKQPSHQWFALTDQALIAFTKAASTRPRSTPNADSPSASGPNPISQNPPTHFRFTSCDDYAGKLSTATCTNCSSVSLATIEPDLCSAVH